MNERATWGLIGPGNVGNELKRQLGKDYVSERLQINQLPEFIVRSSGVMKADGVTSTGLDSLNDIDNFPDVTFIAMPSQDEGKAAKEYIDTVLDRGKMVITAEKGALANHFDYLKEKSEDFKTLGINATVGGGTRLLGVLDQYVKDNDNITQLHLALNGTLAAIMSSIAPQYGTGMSLGQAVQHAVELGYAEPGADTPYEVIRGEAEGDIPKKTAILFNVLGLADTLDWKSLKFDLSNEDISQAVEEARVRRFIVSIYSSAYQEKTHRCPEEDIIGGFDVVKDGWRLVGGFRHIDRNPLFSYLSGSSGPNNGFVIGLGPDETDGVYSLVGPGAGIRPTANTMIDDYVSKVKV